MGGPGGRPAEEEGERKRRAHQALGAYREVPAPVSLRGVVECFWLRDAGPARPDGVILPDGCVDIIWADRLEPFVAGPATLPAAAGVDASHGIVAVRFRPGVARQMLGVDAPDLLNQRIPLYDIWPRHRAAAWEAAMTPPAPDARLAAISALIAERLDAGGGCDPLVQEIVAWLAAHPRGRVETLAQRFGLGERQARRRFIRAVGYGPKMLQRVLRLQRLLWLARSDLPQVAGLSQMARAAGFADQAHMTRDVVALTGETPRRLLQDSQRDSAVSELFKTTMGRDATMAS